MRFPRGIQSFEALRRGGYCYVDKTALIHKMVADGKYYFLSRPRRFGKSLLQTTLQAYFEGKRELFKGLDIDLLSTEWDEHPVLLLDLSGVTRADNAQLRDILNAQLAAWENRYNLQQNKPTTMGVRFRNIIETAYEATGKQVVVLVDEYDKPIFEAIGNQQLRDTNTDLLKELYINIKILDKYIRFALLTGVTRFSKISIFSALNNLNDISMDEDYATICGITESELLTTFKEPIEALAKKNKYSVRRACAELRKMYDGYHFHPHAQGVYNPYSLLLALSRNELGTYWFETGTPTFLVRMIRDRKTDLQRFADEVLATDSELKSTEEPTPLSSLLFQAGYITIKKREKNGIYRLTFPNMEVRTGFTESLAQCYLANERGENTFSEGYFLDDLSAGRIDDFMLRLGALFADFDYRLIANAEVHFQSAVYIICTLLGYKSEAERCTSNGRMDYVLYTRKYIYIFEFKINESAERALQQIDEKGYAAPFAADKREVIKVGVNFSTEGRCLEGYEVSR